MYPILVSALARRDLRKLPDSIQNLILAKVEELAKEPRARNVNVTRLKGSSLFRLRIGDYRVIYEVDHLSPAMTLVRIGHRRDVYE